MIFRWRCPCALSTFPSTYYGLFFRQTATGKVLSFCPHISLIGVFMCNFSFVAKDFLTKAEMTTQESFNADGEGNADQAHAQDAQIGGSTGPSPGRRASGLQRRRAGATPGPDRVCLRGGCRSAGSARVDVPLPEASPRLPHARTRRRPSLSRACGSWVAAWPGRGRRGGRRVASAHRAGPVPGRPPGCGFGGGVVPGPGFRAGGPSGSAAASPRPRGEGSSVQSARPGPPGTPRGRTCAVLATAPRHPEPAVLSPALRARTWPRSEAGGSDPGSSRTDARGALRAALRGARRGRGVRAPPLLSVLSYVVRVFLIRSHLVAGAAFPACVFLSMQRIAPATSRSSSSHE